MRRVRTAATLDKYALNSLFYFQYDCVPHAKLIKIRFPRYSGACLAQSHHYRCIVRAGESIEGAGAACGWIFCGADIVFYGDTASLERRIRVICT
jgi:hypothetical protein